MIGALIAALLRNRAVSTSRLFELELFELEEMLSTIIPSVAVVQDSKQICHELNYFAAQSRH